MSPHTMPLRHPARPRHNPRHGFTIVELLVVIVVIAILAAIVIVAYNGLSGRAVESSMQSDLKNVGTTLGIDNTKNSAYPASAALANDGQGLKVSGSNQLTYALRPYGYCAAITNTKSSKAFQIKSSTGRVEEGQCTAFVSTLAGSNTHGTADGTGVAAQFHYPRALAVDSAGTVYVADTDNNRIRKVSPAGVVTTLAGSSNGFADGTGAAAQFSQPRGLTVDASGTVYVSDSGNNRIRKITPAGVVTTFAGSGTAGFVDATGVAAQFNAPRGLAVDTTGTVYVSESNNNSIRKITPAGVVTTFAGSGTAGFVDATGVAAQFNAPQSVAVDAVGTVYVADTFNYRIRKITPLGVVTTLAGGFSGPFGVAVDTTGTVYVGDASTANVIRKITPLGVVTTFAGLGTASFADGPAATAWFWGPVSVAVDTAGTVYVADVDNNRIRAISQ